MISNDISNTETVRNVYIIDDKGIIKAIFVYPMNIGRFIPEIIRTIQALQVSECSKGMTAANWIPNQPIIMPMPKTYCELQERTNQMREDRNGISWYLGFKNIEEKCKKSDDAK